MKTPLSIQIVLTGLLGAFSVGCGGGGGVSVRMAASERVDLEPGMATTGSIEIPGKEAFNYNHFTRGSDGPEAGGHARPTQPSGAECRAEVTGKGTAFGAFELGYGFDNLTGKPLLASFTLGVKKKSNKEPKRGSVEGSGTTRLWFLVKDTVGQELISQDIISTTLSKGADSVDTPYEDFPFEGIRLEPDRGYYVVLAGRTEVKNEGDEKAAMSLVVEDVSLKITWREAPAAVHAQPQAGSGAVTTNQPRGTVTTP